MKSLNSYKLITIIADLLLIALIINSFFLFENIKKERAVQSGRLEMLSAGNQLIKTSDMLTTEARSFTVTSDLKHFKNYWHEVEIDKNRDKAVDMLKKLSGNEGEINLLIQSKRNSDALIQTELRSMRLMFDGYDVPEELMPSVLKEYEPSATDTSLPKEDKVSTAQKILFDETYAMNKAKIFDPINEFELKLTNRTISEAKKAKEKTNITLNIMMALSGILVVLILVISWQHTSQKFQSNAFVKKPTKKTSKPHHH